MADETQDNGETLAEMTEDALRALAEQLRTEAAAHAGAAAGEGDAEATAAVVGAAEKYQEVLAELGGREQARREDQERAARAAEILNQPLPGEVVEDAPAEGEAAPEAVAAAADATVTLTDDTPTVPVVPSPEAVALAVAPPDPAQVPATPEAPVADNTPDDGLDLSNIAQPVATMAQLAGEDSVGAVLTLESGLSPNGREWARPNRLRMNARRAEAGSLIEFTDLGQTDQSERGNAINGRRLAESIAEKYDAVKRFGVTPGAPPIKMASAQANHELKLGGDPILNARMLQEYAQEFAHDVALVASGGNCAIPVNNYDVFNAAVEQSPVEGFLRGMGAERGGMRYLAAPDWVASQAGVAVTTDEQDALGYSNQDPAGPTPPKVCYQAECPTELECIVDAVSACAGFGNLTYRTAPELVQVLLDQLAVAHAQAKEITYLDGIEAGSTAVTTIAESYSAVRSSVLSIDNAVWAYKKRNHIARNASIDVLAPDTMIPLLKADAVADLHLGMDFLSVDQETLAAQLFETMNINVEFYYDYSTAQGATSAMQESQGAGHLHNLPTDFRLYAYAPGTWIRLDGGVLNVGLVRDSILNSQNNLQLFSEEWTQVCKVGFESIALDLTLCPSGVGPEPTADVRACAS